MNEKQRLELGNSLIKSAGSTELSDASVEALDIAVDALMDDGILKDIPIFGWAVKAIKAGQNIRDAIFLRKIAMFLKGVSGVSADEKREFTEKIENDVNHRQKVGENLLLLIDRHERIEKSLLLGRLFAAYMKNELSNEGFMRLSAALDKAIIEDLEELNKCRPHYFMLPKQAEEGLYRCGMMNIKIEVPELNPRLAGNGLKMKGEYDYEFNELGKVFIKYAFEPLKKDE